MITIKKLINKITWDDRLNPDDYVIFYLDRIENKLIELEFNKIKEIDGTFMVIDDVLDTRIPLHRVRKVTKKREVIWERK